MGLCMRCVRDNSLDSAGVCAENFVRIVIW
jgi:hypothetical protein